MPAFPLRRVKGQQACLYRLLAAAPRKSGARSRPANTACLCHNSRDFEQVAAIAARLRERGILPWLAPRDIRPGQRWPDELHENLKSVGSVAVFVGPKGTGPWQDLEVELALKEFARRKRQRVDMRQPDPDPFEMLVWGITGDRPAWL